MESGSKWRQKNGTSDVSDESDKGGSGKRGGAISQTGSWRRGMSAQVGVTTPRTKNTTVTSGPGMMKTHGTGGCALVILLHWPSVLTGLLDRGHFLFECTYFVIVGV